MENNGPKEYYDERSRLWYRVQWDDEIKCFVWTISPHQKLIADDKPKQPRV